ncbi:hypothetical protein ABTE85_22780, partial [Acinetobacter baumannii]
QCPDHLRAAGIGEQRRQRTEAGIELHASPPDETLPVDDERYWPPSPVRASPRQGRTRMSVDLHALIPLIALTFLLAGFVKG